MNKKETNRLITVSFKLLEYYSNILVECEVEYQNMLEQAFIMDDCKYNYHKGRYTALKEVAEKFEKMIKGEKE